MKIRNPLPKTGVGDVGKQEELESNKSVFDFDFSILFPGLDPSLHWLEADAAPRFPIHHQTYQNGRIMVLNP